MIIFNDQFYIIIGTSSITSESEDIGIMADMQEVMDKDDSTFIEHISVDPSVSVTGDLGDINTGPARPILQVSFQFLLKKIVKLTANRAATKSLFVTFFLHSHENSQLLSLFCVTIEDMCCFYLDIQINKIEYKRV